MSLAKSIVARRLGLQTGPTVIVVKPSPPRRAPKAAKPAPRPSPVLEQRPRPVAPPPAPPPRAINPGWRGSCQAVCAVTGRRCRLPEHRVNQPHRHERGAFTITAATGQTEFAGRSELERAAARRHSNPVDLTP